MIAPTWETRIAAMRSWTRGSEHAVHKPLLVLMILARAQRGGSNVFEFRDLDEPLRASLRAFGPPRKAYRSEYPFWYLKDDGFWVVCGAARLAELKRGREPSRRLLLAENAAAEVPAGLWEELVQEPARAARLAQTVLENYWPAEMRSKVRVELVLKPLEGHLGPQGEPSTAITTSHSG